LLLNDQFILQDGQMYRIDTPKRKALAKLVQLRKRLCVPKKYQHEVIRFAHDCGGHFATHRLFLTLSAKYYWKTLFSDINDFCKTCETCQACKRNCAHRMAPLHPLPVGEYPGQVWMSDFKPLVRPTKQGNTAILIFIDSFSNWPVLVAVKDQSAETAAIAFFEHVVSVYGYPEVLGTDKGSAYMSAFFAKINELLGIKHRSSATMVARSNGLSESVVKRVIEQLKIYAEDDLDVERVLPMIAMHMRATAHSRLS